MSYTYSFERTRSTLDPADFIQEQNDIYETENSDEFTDVFLDVDKFDPDEIL